MPCLLTVEHYSRTILVSVAQLAELWIVVPAVAGSNPVAHPLNLFDPCGQKDVACDFLKWYAAVGQGTDTVV
jgi:hypothetical protein